MSTRAASTSIGAPSQPSSVFATAMRANKQNQTDRGAVVLWNFRIIKQTAKYVKQFWYDAHHFVVQVFTPPKNTDVIAYLEMAKLKIFEYIRSLSTDESDFVGVSMHSAEFANAGSAGLSFRPLRALLLMTTGRWSLKATKLSKSTRVLLSRSALWKIHTVPMVVKK